MPANLTPQYKKAEEAFRQATTVEEKIACLEEMLAIIPKHKGTDHLQADLKRRLAQFRDQQRQGKKKSGAGRVDPFAVPRAGAGQVVLIGAPNCGKSAIVGALTNARVTVADYPFSTTAPVPGVAKHEDVPIQLVDMPPLSGGTLVPGAAGTLRMGDIILIVVDLSADCLEQYEACRAALAERGMAPVWSPGDAGPETGETPKVAVVACTKCDLSGAEETFAAFRELVGREVNAVAVSPVSGAGLKDLMARFFKILGVMRVYAKRINQPPDLEEPFVLPIGSCVEDLARIVHRDLPEKIKYAKVWGANVFPGQQVMRDHVLSDKDVVELHI
jgi:ribosome-interacting GTPase 1